ncbi:MAG: CvpA family protein [Clostridia bacterium]|nr:CvpA family protein [Clostridia bacterium]
MSGIILDVILVVVVVLLLIFGIWRGMYKLIFGLVSSLLAIILTIVLMSTVTSFIVERTTLDEKLVEALDEPMGSAIPNGEVTIYYYDSDDDGTEDTLGYMLDGVQYPLSSLFDGTPYALFGGVIASVVGDRVEMGEEVVFKDALTATVVGYIISAIVFIALLIVFTIIVKLLMYLIKKFVTRTYLGHFLDKFLGAVLGLAIAAIVIWGALAVIRLLGTYEWIIPVNNLIESSTLTKFLYTNNYLYTFLVNSMDIKSIIDSIISTIGGVTESGGAAESGEAVAEVIGRVALPGMQ